MPYKIDLFAIFIFLGIVQAVFLSVFFLLRDNRKLKANVFSGALLIALAACSFEIFLMYTGYIQDCLYLVDFSEPLSFLIGPLVYLITIANTKGVVRRRNYWHLAFAGVYLILVFPFFLLPEEVKYNCWIEAFNVNLPKNDYDYLVRIRASFGSPIITRRSP